MEPQSSPYIEGIAHIALVVPDLDAAWQQFAALGYTQREDGTVDEPDYGVKVKVLFNGPVVLELIVPYGAPEDSPYAAQLKEKRYCMDHIGYWVSDLAAAVELLKKEKFIPISKPKVTKIWNKTAILMAHRKMGIIELLEK